MAQAIVKKLLHEPTVRLRSAAEAQDTSVLADAAGELFGLTPAEGLAPPVPPSEPELPPTSQDEDEDA
jgi:hypothetical protein